ncbi:MAG TPA: Gfo/Idh/MocA family oxidoreductase [Thermomicrobiales bacterium]|jgi:predicted dehydrogenase
MDKVRAGIIGCGGIAKTHAAALADLPEATFAACCDIDEARARALAEQYAVPHVFTDIKELLHSGTVDMVLICTPHPSHAGIVVAAAEAGVHVLCEKPLTIDLGESDRMVEAAERAGIKFGGIFQRRFWPAAQRIHEAIEAGELGRLTLAECQVRIWRPREYFAKDAWRGKWATEGGGALMNQAVHAIDLFQWYMGPITEIFGRYATLLHGDYIDVEDTVVATVVFANGALGIIEAATTVKPDLGFKVAVHGTSNAMVSVWEQPEGNAGVIDLWTIQGQEEHRDVFAEGRERVPGFPEFHRLQIQDFVRAVRDDREPAVTGAEARKALEIILAIYHSSRTGLPVRLPLDRAALLAAQA